MPSLETAPSAPAAQATPSRIETRRPWKQWLPFLLFSVLWLDLVRLLSGNWEAREEYAYGWFVPFFAAALLWRRWQDRPLLSSGSPQDLTSGSAGIQVSGRRFQVLSFAFIILLCLLLLPLRVIFEINADWPLIAWLYTSVVVVLTLYAFHLADPSRSVACDHRPPTAGVLSPWVRHFAFPVAFILVALVWPYRIEKPLTQNLMQAVAAINVEILGWINIPALQRGNLIELAGGVLGVDEACSGIRSIQSTLMAALLLGELYRLRILPRIALVGMGLGLAFCFNVVRTFLLSYQAETNGIGAIDKWHDPAGFTIAIVCFVCLWTVALLFPRRWSTPSSSDLVDPTTESRPLASGSSFSASSAPRSLVPRYLLFCGVWVVLCLFATRAWYNPSVPERTTPDWTVQMPAREPSFKEISLPDRVRKSLAYDSAATGEWQEPGGAEWMVYFFRWKADSLQSVIRARDHRPEICLPASGLREVFQSETETIPVAGIELPIRKYTFQQGPQPIHVFFVLWQNGADRQVGIGRVTQAERLYWVKSRRKLLSQQTLELILTGYDSLEEAETAVRTRLPSLIKTEILAANR